MSDEMIRRLAANFTQRLSVEAEAVGVGQGRVEDFGHHTDYALGYVGGHTIDLTCRVAMSRRSDTRLHIVSREQDGVFFADFPQSRIEDTPLSWVNYPLGVLFGLRRHFQLPGLNVYIESDVPQGKGLSSSAALELSVARCTLALLQKHFDPFELAVLCKWAENEVADAPCGLLDQAVVALAQENHMVAIDCKEITACTIPVNFPNSTFLVADTGQGHSLTDDTDYRNAGEDCRQALLTICDKSGQGFGSLGDVPEEILVQHAQSLTIPQRFRALHVIRTIPRARRAAGAVQEGTTLAFGNMLTATHGSLRDLHRVSTPELDRLAAGVCMRAEVEGACMMGGGGGGGLLIFVNGNPDPVRKWISTFAGIDTEDILVCNPSAGAWGKLL